MLSKFVKVLSKFDPIFFQRQCVVYKTENHARYQEVYPDDAMET